MQETNTEVKGYRVIVAVPQEEWKGFSPYTQKVFDLMGEAASIMRDREPKYGDSWTQQGIDGLTFSIVEKLRRFWHRVMWKGEVPDREDTLDAVNFLLFIQALAEVEGQAAVTRMRVKAIKDLFS